MSKRTVRRIPNLPSQQLSFKAVGIYARVSTQRPSQFSSISSQISALVQQVYHTCYGYKKDANGDFIIVPEEAENVRLIYRLYLEGKSIIAISRELEKRGIPSPTGKTTWCRRAIDSLLSNEKYRGNSVATAPLMSDDSKSKQRSKYMLSKHHTAIIDNEQFEAVAAEKKRRSNIEYDENGVHRKHTRYTSTKALQKYVKHHD